MLATNTLLATLYCAGCGKEVKAYKEDDLLLRVMNAHALDLDVAKLGANSVGSIASAGGGLRCMMWGKLPWVLARQPTGPTAARGGMRRH